MIDRVELLNRLWKRAEDGYYDDKPVYQFSKDVKLVVHILKKWIGILLLKHLSH